MQAIVTKYIPATSKRPARIKAICARGYITLSLNFEGQDHDTAANVLCKKFAFDDQIRYGTPLDKNVWMSPRVSGELPNGDFAHVFLS